MFDEELLQECEKVVKQQIDVGIDFVSDGEMSKFSYATYIKDRIDGFSGESERRAPRTLMTSQNIKKRLPRVEVLLPIQGHAVQMSLS